jgi:mRNA interferase RelE/StbE
LAWKIEFGPKADKTLDKIDNETARRIARFLFERVAPLDNPRSIGEALQGPTLGKYWKYRVGDWRIIASIEDEAVRILIVEIGNRREVYRR